MAEQSDRENTPKPTAISKQKGKAKQEDRELTPMPGVSSNKQQDREIVAFVAVARAIGLGQIDGEGLPGLKTRIGDQKKGVVQCVEYWLDISAEVDGLRNGTKKERVLAQKQASAHYIYQLCGFDKDNKSADLEYCLEIN